MAHEPGQIVVVFIIMMIVPASKCLCYAQHSLLCVFIAEMTCQQEREKKIDFSEMIL